MFLIIAISHKRFFAIDTCEAVICSLRHGRKHLITILTILLGDQALRRISCHGRNHSQANCEYSLTIFLCCQHHSEHSLLGLKFSTNLLFAASKYHVTMQQRSSSSVQNGRTGWDRCSGKTLLAPCTKKKRLQRKITKYYHWIGVQENIGMFSKS